MTRQLNPHLTVAKTAEYATGAADSSIPLRLSLVPVNSKAKGHRRTLSAPLQHNNDAAYAPNLESNLIEEENYSKSPPSSRKPLNSLELSPRTGHRMSFEFSSDVYDLLSLRSERPEIHGLFENRHNGRSAIRIATWNLGKLTLDKILSKFYKLFEINS